ncbi:hypothetical protein [Streptomyces sp. NPDC058084]|uniref:hypothetical protein n=1 Tax=Streptomyces sp. NPDC058084 TaxID=3346333 RepID=UPI0036E82E9E
MTGMEFLASFLTTGELYGLGVGSTLDEVDRALPHPFVDVVGEEGDWLRRDYGLVEFAFTPEPDPGPASEWLVATVTVQLHRLASDDDLACAWERSTGVGRPVGRRGRARTPEGVPDGAGSRRLTGIRATGSPDIRPTAGGPRYATRRNFVYGEDVTVAGWTVSTHDLPRYENE